MKKVFIDVRSLEAYREKHVEGSFSFPWDNIRDESCGLPPRDVALTVFIDEHLNEDAVRAYFSHLHFSTFDVRKIQLSDVLVREPPLGFCWRPNPFLGDVIHLIEKKNRGCTVAADVGSGTGRDMVFLASRGWHLIGVESRPRLIQQGLLLAKKHNLSHRICYIRCFIKSIYPIHTECVDLLHICRFLHRPSLSLLLQLPRHGGFLVYSHFLEGCAETAVGHPSSLADYFLRGELKDILTAAGYLILHESEILLSDGRPMINIFAQRK